jgi:hypothetical protein
VSTDEAAGDAGPESNASGRLFDLRELIAGIFIVFGILLIVVGALDGQAELDKASGVRINLWTGIGMVVLGLVFVAWRLWRPLRREDLVPDDDADSGAPSDPISGH